MKLSLRSFLTFLVIFFIFALFILFNSFSHLRNVLTDKLYGGKDIIENIVLVKIDDESINKIGRWPWNRDVFAKILGNIENAKVIGMDLSFFEESENDTLLKDKLDSLDNVVLAAEITDKLYKPIFDTNFGYVNFKADADGVIRKVDLRLSEDVLPFSFEIYKKGFNENFKPLKKEYMINFANKPGSFTSISAFDVYKEKIDFKDKIVLIGATAPDLHDNYFVPVSDGIAMSGVEIHANILQNLILANFLMKQGKFSILLFVLIIGFVGFFVLSRLKIYYVIPLLLLLLVLYFFMAVIAFNIFNYMFGLLFFSLASLVFIGGGVGINYIEQKKHSAFLTDAFGRYISKDLLKQIVDKKSELKLGGLKKTITIFFSDIRGFTSISEKLKAEELVGLLNEYLTEMTKIVLENKGTVDKFIGDAVMAFWNAPLDETEHSFLACKTAIRQIEVLKGLREKWKKEELPEIKIGVGIHTGEAIIGNMGSEDRFDYTAIGDSVNLASRLEGLTKQYGVDIIISESVYDKVKERFKTRKLDEVKVKGKKKPVSIYELIVDYNGEFVLQYDKALKLYFKMKFKEALEEFEKALKIKEDKVCEVLLERCREYIKNPPKEMAFEFKSK